MRIGNARTIKLYCKLFVDIFKTYSIEFTSLNGTKNIIPIKEPELEPDVDYSKAAVPF